MYQKELKVSYGEGRYRILITAIITADGISVTITGGEKPHVGGTAVSVPRRRQGADRLTCDTWVVPVPGHKDSEVAAIVAEALARETGQTAAVVAGIHIDAAEPWEIEKLVAHSREAARLLVEQIDEQIKDKR